MLVEANFCWILPDTQLPADATLPGVVPSGLGTRALLSAWPETPEENFFEDLLHIDPGERELPS
eukprot:4884401-Prorocentrum_lima.AAC.1